MGSAFQDESLIDIELEARSTALMRYRIDMSRVKLDVLKSTIRCLISHIYNIENFVYEELKREQRVCPKNFQLKLLEFLSLKKAQQFMTQLWVLLYVSQESGIGVPPFIMERLIKEGEILKREEEKKQKRNDSFKCINCSCSRCSMRDDRVVNDKDSNPSSSKWEKSRSRDKQLDKNTSPCNHSKDKSVQRVYPSRDIWSPQSENESAYSLKTSQSKSSQKNRDNSCMRNSKSRSKSIEKQGASSTSKYALRRYDDTSDDSDESRQCAWCGRTSCSPKSSVSSNQSRSSRRRSATQEDDRKQEYRREKQIAEVAEKRKHSDAKDTTTVGSQTSVKRSKTSSEKEITLAMKGSSVAKSEHKKTKSDTESGEAVNGGKVVLEVALANCIQSAMNNKCKKLKNDSSHMNDQLQVKKKHRKSKKCSSKRNSVDHCPRNSEAGSSKNNGSEINKLMHEQRRF